MKKILFLYIIALTMFSCESYNDSKIMDFIKEIEFDDSYILLEEDTLIMDGVYTGDLWAKDSLLFFFSSKFTDYKAYVFNKRTKEHIASLFPRGDGPHEYPRGVSVTWDVHSLANGDWGVWFYNESSEYQLVNMSRSVRENKTIVDSVVPYKYYENQICPFILTYFFNDTILARTQSIKEYNADKQYIPVEYFIFSNSMRKGNSDKLVVYKDYIPESNNSELSYQDFFYSSDEYNPQQHKIAMGMARLPQINIVDVCTKEAVGYRLKGGCSFGDVASQKKLRTYYRSITTNDRYIFLLYSGGVEANYPAYTQTIHVIDWEGKPIAQLRTPSRIGYIFVDTGSNLLYGQDDNDNYYCYDLSKYELFQTQ